MQEFDQNWQKRSEAVLVGRNEWREQHPKATCTEMEAALEERLGRLRARLFQESALASASSTWKEVFPEERPKRPLCGTPLVARGKKTRRLQTQGGKK